MGRVGKGTGHALPPPGQQRARTTCGHPDTSSAGSRGKAHGLSFPTLVLVLFTRNLPSVISIFREKQCVKSGIKNQQISRKGPFTEVLGIIRLLSVLEGVKQSRQCALPQI